MTDLPQFLAATGIGELTVKAAEAEVLEDDEEALRLLQYCTSVHTLVCRDGFTPDCWPPHLVDLELHHRTGGDHSTYDSDEDTCIDADDICDLQQVQLLRLRHAANLQHLKLHTGAACEWPAGLRCRLPASLQTVNVLIHAEGDVRIDLSRFTPAAGCTAALQVEVHEEDIYDKGHRLEGILRALAALPSFSSLQVKYFLPDRLWHLSLLEQVQCERLVLDLRGDTTIEHLPAVQHWTILVDPLYWGDMLFVEWSALMCPGVHCFGSVELAMRDLHFESYTGLPVLASTGASIDAPWALVIWADRLHVCPRSRPSDVCMQRVPRVCGVPASCFVEEVPGKHVWRNAAAKDMVL